MTDLSTTYENDTIAYAKANPTVQAGQLVHIWNHDDPTNPFYCGKGLAKKLIWDSYYMSWVIEVDYFFEGRVQRYTVMAGCCERYVGKCLRLV